MAAIATALLAEEANRHLRRELAGGAIETESLHQAISRLLLQVMVLSAAAAVPPGEVPLIHAPDRSPGASDARRQLAAAIGSICVLGPAPASSPRSLPSPSLWRTFHEVAAAIGGAPEAAAARERFAIAPIGGWLFGGSAPPGEARIGLDQWRLPDEPFIAAIAPLREAIAAHLALHGSIGHLGLGAALSHLLDRELRVASGGEVDLVASPRRRRLGSHFTPPRLVEHLLAEALDPLIERAQSHPRAAASKLLGIALCDPSAGAGHLLVEAARRIAEAVRRARGDAEPAASLREVVARCIHGVEKHPLTAATCEAALWLETASAGVPMKQAVPNLRLGDALLGADPLDLAAGVPPLALATRGGDDPEAAASLRREHRRERRRLADASLPATQLAADAWCAAFFWRKAAGGPGGVAGIGERLLREIAAEPARFPPGTPLRDEIDRIAAERGFLHPHLAFPQVFAGGGFDCIVGNPPFLSRLAAATAACPATAALLRQRTGGSIRGYADASAAFLLLWSRHLRRGGRLAMVQPHSLLASRDTSAVRRSLLEHAALAGLWVAGEPVFERTGVLTCVPTLVAGESPPEIARTRGREFERMPPLAVEQEAIRDAATWSQFAADLASLPAIELPRSAALGALAIASADFRDEYYAIAAAIVDSREPGGEAADPPILTSGLVDLACCGWGEREVRIHHRRWLSPRLCRDRLDPRHASWLARRLVPKAILATQTRVLEVLVDETGRYLPCTPLISIEPRRREDLWLVAAAAASPAACLLLRRLYAGTSLARDAIKPTAAAIRSVPLPADRERWERGAAALRHAHLAEDPAKRREHLLRFAEEMSRAAAAREEDARILEAWWVARFEAASRTQGRRRPCGVEVASRPPLRHLLGARR